MKPGSVQNVARPGPVQPSLASRDRHKGLVTAASDQAIEGFVDPIPVWKLRDILEPAPDVRICRKIDLDGLTQRHQASSEIISDGQLIAAQIVFVRTKPVIIKYA